MPVMCECFECGKVYPLTDAGFVCDHTEPPVIGWSWTQAAADQLCMIYEARRREENRQAEIAWLTELYKAA